MIRGGSIYSISIILFTIVICTQFYSASSLSDSCQALGCPQCVGDSGVCCGEKASGNHTSKCNPQCIESGRTCCGCNPLSNGQWSCFACLSTDVCVDNTDTDSPLLKFCASESSTVVPQLMVAVCLSLLVLLSM